MKIFWKTLCLAGSLLVLLALVVSFRAGIGINGLFSRSQVEIPQKTPSLADASYGRWYAARQSGDPLSVDRETLTRLTALGYLGGYNLAKDAGGARVLDAEAVQDGLTLFSSGHAPVAYLISLDGEVVHKWQVTFEEVWPDALPFEHPVKQKEYIRRAYVFPNGDLLAIFSYIGIFKLDRDSNVLWKNPSQNHHDFAIGADGTIVSLAQRHVTAQELTRKYPGYSPPANGIFDDHLVFLDASGVEFKRISIFDAIYRSDYAPLLTQTGESIDIFHANSVHIVATRQERSGLKAGEILVSLRSLDAIVSVDIVEGRATWMLSGKWKAQHQAHLLDNGNILLLDNLGGNKKTPLKLDQSEVLEVDPVSQKIEWRYGGSDESPFFTPKLGYVQRLPNGNTLVTETTYGRIFEVTQNGHIVWEFLSPHRAGDKDELIATVMGGRRVGAEDLEFLRHFDAESAELIDFKKDHKEFPRDSDPKF